MARHGARARARGRLLTWPDRSPARVAPYFDGLYRALASSPTHARIGREALGDAFAGQIGFAGERELLRLAEVAGFGPGRRVLELCCGTGGVAAWYARRTGAEVVGVDCSLAGLTLGARAAGRPARAQFALGDLRRLPFTDASLDAIVCIDGFGTDFAPLAAETLRLLRPGGGLALLISLPAGDVAGVVRTFQQSGAADAFCEDQTEQASVLMRRWLDLYRRHAEPHIAEIGERYHRGLVDEIARLLDEYAAGGTQRVLIAARRF